MSIRVNLDEATEEWFDEYCRANKYTASKWNRVTLVRFFVGNRLGVAVNSVHDGSKSRYAGDHNHIIITTTDALNGRNLSDIANAVFVSGGNEFLFSTMEVETEVETDYDFGARASGWITITYSKKGT